MDISFWDLLVEGIYADNLKTIKVLKDAIVSVFDHPPSQVADRGIIRGDPRAVCLLADPVQKELQRGHLLHTPWTAEGRMADDMVDLFAISLAIE